MLEKKDKIRYAFQSAKAAPGSALQKSVHQESQITAINLHTVRLALPHSNHLHQLNLRKGSHWLILLIPQACHCTTSSNLSICLRGP